MKADKGNTIMILYQVNTITDNKNFLTVMKLQPLILVHFILKAYKQSVNGTKTLIWKEVKWKLCNHNATAPKIGGLIKLHKPHNPMRPVVLAKQTCKVLSQHHIFKCPTSLIFPYHEHLRTIIWSSRDSISSTGYF